MIATDTDNAIISKNLPKVPFENVIYDKTFGSIVNGDFIAPVDGLYRFEFQVYQND